MVNVTAWTTLLVTLSIATSLANLASERSPPKITPNDEITVSVPKKAVKSSPGKAPKIALNDGKEIPILGLGTALGGGNAELSEYAVKEALAVGYRHLDTAAIYGTEEAVGKGLQAKIDDGTVRREDVFVTTKLWGDRHEEDQVVPALNESLTRLGLDYVDLYLIHWPVSHFSNGTLNDVDYLETWRGMEEAQRLGLAKSIGVSNFNKKQLERLLNNSVVEPAVNQIEVNPNLRQKELVDFCQSKGIVVVAYSPLGSMSERRSQKDSAPDPRIDDLVLLAIGSKHYKTTVQIVLRYLIDRGVVPIPKSVTSSRIRQNIDIFDFKLNPRDMAKLDEFNIDHRVISASDWKDSPHYPF